MTAPPTDVTGFLLVTPLLGVGCGLVLLWTRWGSLRDAGHLLMEGTPAEISLAEVTEALEALDNVKNAHHVHAWALTSGRHVFSGHLRIAEDADPQNVLRAAYKMLKDEYDFFFATLQVETACLDEAGAEAIDITRTADAGPE